MSRVQGLGSVQCHQETARSAEQLQCKGARIMWVRAGVDLLNQQWVSVLDQYWPYAVLVVQVATLSLLWHTWEKVRSTEIQMSLLIFQLQKLESRVVLEAARSAALPSVESPGSDSPPIVPEASNSTTDLARWIGSKKKRPSQ
jgi:hypothetical protein